MSETAQAVLASLLDAGVQAPMGFDMEVTAEQWADALRPFAPSDLTAAVGDWVGVYAQLPTREEFVQLAQEASRRRHTEDRPLDVECPECDGVRYVTVIDGKREVETFASKKRHRLGHSDPWVDDGDPENREYIEIVDSHKRPCSRCIPDRHDLHSRGHWDEGHEPCPQCMRYRDPARWKAVLKRAPA